MPISAVVTAEMLAPPHFRIEDRAGIRAMAAAEGPASLVRRGENELPSASQTPHEAFQPRRWAVTDRLADAECGNRCGNDGGPLKMLVSVEH